jgi:hypothetical protein
MILKFLLVFVIYVPGAFCNCLISEKDSVGKSYDELNKLAKIASTQKCQVDLIKNSKAEQKVFKVLFGMHRCNGDCSDGSKSDDVLMQEACFDGFQDACFIVKSAEASKNQNADLAYAYNLCDKKSSKACELLAVDLMAKNPVESRKYFEIACKLKSHFACERINISNVRKN